MCASSSKRMQSYQFAVKGDETPEGRNTHQRNAITDGPVPLRFSPLYPLFPTPYSWCSECSHVQNPPSPILHIDISGAFRQVGRSHAPMNTAHSVLSDLPFRLIGHLPADISNSLFHQSVEHTAHLHSDISYDMIFSFYTSALLHIFVFHSP